MMPVIVFGQYYTVFLPPILLALRNPFQSHEQFYPTQLVLSNDAVTSPSFHQRRVGAESRTDGTVVLQPEMSPCLQCASAYVFVQYSKRPMNPSTRNPQQTKSASHELGPRGQLVQGLVNTARRLCGVFGICNLRKRFVDLRGGFVETPWRLREAF